MGKPVIIEAGRSAIGKRNGQLAETHAATLPAEFKPGFSSGPVSIRCRSAR